jgi:hypothetical protein
MDIVATQKQVDDGMWCLTAMFPQPHIEVSGYTTSWTFTPAERPMPTYISNSVGILTGFSFDVSVPMEPLYTATYQWRSVPKRYRRIVNALNRLLQES